MGVSGDTVKYTMKAHPTQFQNVNFRSRLEAKWAAFFDLCGWDWVYEPVDFDGWSPDFLIRGHETLYVEVKPILKFDEETASKMDNALRDVGDCEPLLLGLGPFADTCNSLTAIGWLGQDMREFSALTRSNPQEFSFDFGEATIVRYSRERCESGGYRENGCKVATHSKTNHILGIAHSNQSYTDRISGHYCGGHLDGPDLSSVEWMWRSAGNIVQWRKP